MMCIPTASGAEAESIQSFKTDIRFDRPQTPLPKEPFMNILQINSSARSWANGQGSQSTRLANDLVEQRRAAPPEATLTLRDLTAKPHPALDEHALGALFTPADARSAEQHARVALDQELI